MKQVIDWSKAPAMATHGINRKGALGTVWYAQTPLGAVWASASDGLWMTVTDAKLPDGCQPRPAEIDWSKAPLEATHALPSSGDPLWLHVDHRDDLWMRCVDGRWVKATLNLLPSNSVCRPVELTTTVGDKPKTGHTSRKNSAAIREKYGCALAYGLADIGYSDGGLVDYETDEITETKTSAPEGATHFDVDTGVYYKAGDTVCVWYTGIGWVEWSVGSLPDNVKHLCAPETCDHKIQNMGDFGRWEARLHRQPSIDSDLEKIANRVAIASGLKAKHSDALTALTNSAEKAMPYMTSLRDALTIASQAFKTDENIVKETHAAGQMPVHKFPREGYEKLHNVYRDAHDHAAYTKGAERHANDLPFHEQRMQTISEGLESPLGMAYQVEKKIKEGLQMPDYGACRRELLGALNYLAGIVIFLDKKNQ